MTFLSANTLSALRYGADARLEKSISQRTERQGAVGDPVYTAAQSLQDLPAPMPRAIEHFLRPTSCRKRSRCRVWAGPMWRQPTTRLCTRIRPIGSPKHSQVPGSSVSNCSTQAPKAHTGWASTKCTLSRPCRAGRPD